MPFTKLTRPSFPVARIGFLVFGIAAAASAIPTPILNFQMNEGTGTNVASTGSTTGNASRSTPPTWSTNTPVGGGAFSLDFGSTASATVRLDFPTPNSIKSLKSFTIAGWLNCRDFNTGGGGNRILVNVLPGGTIPGVGQGIDLAFRDDGSLSLGVNQWNDWGGVRSRGGRIPIDPDASYSNWRFFAVTYNSLLSSDQVKFYFGSNMGAAELDIARTYDAGAVGPTPGTVLTIGNMNLDNRYIGTNQTFRGLIDQIKLYGSATDGTGALSAADIITVQSPMVLPTNGILYEEFTGIPGGPDLSLLVNHATFPNSPTTTVVRSTFDGFQYNTTKNDFGARMSGWIKAPTTGNYTFWITTDDNGELRLSTDANPANKRLIANVPGFAGYNEWEKQFSGATPQKSAPIPLVANQYYYIEALMKEHDGGDHIKVQWQIPGVGTPESPIPSSRLFLAPPTDALPSSYSMYEPFTSIKKATLGWKREAGVGTLYLESDGNKGMTIQNGTATFPRSLFFGGQYPNDPNSNDLGFRWERATLGTIGKLYLETLGGRWAFQVESGSELEPHTEFNRLINITGPDEPDYSSGFTWSGFANVDYFGGTVFERVRRTDGNPEQNYVETSAQNGSGLIVASSAALNSLEAKDSVTINSAGIRLASETNYSSEKSALTLNSGGLTYERTNGSGVPSRTTIDPEGITTARVTTSMWKVSAPDYVFEDGYRLRSLAETERFVKEKKHLPEIPSAKELSAKGLNLTEMNMNLLKKVEELTLHLIAMDKELKALQAERRPGVGGEQPVGAQGAGKGK